MIKNSSVVLCVALTVVKEQNQPTSLILVHTCNLVFGQVRGESHSCPFATRKKQEVLIGIFWNFLWTMPTHATCQQWTKICKLSIRTIENPHAMMHKKCAIGEALPCLIGRHQSLVIPAHPLWSFLGASPPDWKDSCHPQSTPQMPLDTCSTSLACCTEPARSLLWVCDAGLLGSHSGGQAGSWNASLSAGLDCRKYPKVARH